MTITMENVAEKDAGCPNMSGKLRWPDTLEIHSYSGTHAARCVGQDATCISKQDVYSVCHASIIYTVKIPRKHTSLRAHWNAE